MKPHTPGMKAHTGAADATAHTTQPGACINLAAACIQLALAAATAHTLTSAARWRFVHTEGRIGRGSLPTRTWNPREMQNTPRTKGSGGILISPAAS